VFARQTFLAAPSMTCQMISRHRLLRRSSMLSSRHVWNTAMLFSPDHQYPLLTNYHDFWMLHYVLSSVATSSTTHGLSQLQHDDLHWLHVPQWKDTRLVSLCTAVCRVRHPSSWSTVALQSPKLPADAKYIQPGHIIWHYHATRSVPLIVRPSLFYSLTVRNSVTAT